MACPATAAASPPAETPRAGDHWLRDQAMFDATLDTACARGYLGYAAPITRCIPSSRVFVSRYLSDSTCQQALDVARVDRPPAGCASPALPA